MKYKFQYFLKHGESTGSPRGTTPEYQAWLGTKKANCVLCGDVMTHATVSLPSITLYYNGRGPFCPTCRGIYKSEVMAQNYGGKIKCPTCGLQAGTHYTCTRCADTRRKNSEEALFGLPDRIVNPKGKEVRKNMIDQLRNFNDERANVEEMVELFGYATVIEKAYQDTAVSVPEWLTDVKSRIQSTILSRQRDILAKEEKDLQREIDQLKTAAEKREEKTKRLAEIREKLGK